MEVAIGRQQRDDKQMAGDLRTPEGSYHVMEPARQSERFHRFIPLDYPSREDAFRGYTAGRLSGDDLQRILDAHDEGLPPPQDTALGGDIGLHGEGERWRGASARLDWTFGCIAVRDEEIDFLADHVAPGVSVSIHP